MHYLEMRFSIHQATYTHKTKGKRDALGAARRNLLGRGNMHMILDQPHAYIYADSLTMIPWVTLTRVSTLQPTSYNQLPFYRPAHYGIESE